MVLRFSLILFCLSFYSTSFAYVINFLEVKDNKIPTTYKGFNWSDTHLNQYKFLKIDDGELNISRNDPFQYQGTFFEGKAGNRINILGYINGELVLSDEFILSCGYSVYSTNLKLDTIKFISDEAFLVRNLKIGDDLVNCGFNTFGGFFSCPCTNQKRRYLNPGTTITVCPPPIQNPNKNPPPTAPVPEPNTFLLLASGLGLFGVKKCLKF